mmetsp:Transcript_12710/g.19164  ORF Transcript_12710/g.19164 Transcript_12710/m.19164 type:complete len:114 (-) Transcript_12710:317-658(-)
MHWHFLRPVKLLMFVFDVDVIESSLPLARKRKSDTIGATLFELWQLVDAKKSNVNSESVGSKLRLKTLVHISSTDVKARFCSLLDNRACLFRSLRVLAIILLPLGLVEFNNSR